MRKRVFAILLSVIVCAGILSECNEPQVLENDQIEIDSVDSKEIPYTVKLKAPFDIFEDPDYDSILVDTIWEKGLFTIVEEKEDGEGNLWGKLKSGQGWIDLTKNSNESELPIGAGLIQENEIPKDAIEVILDESEYMVRLAFVANETLKDVRFTSIYLTDEGIVDDTLHAFAELKEGQVFVAGVVFAGDMTTFGLEFTDTKGELKYYAAYMSGRNGELILQEENIIVR